MIFQKLVYVAKTQEVSIGGDFLTLNTTPTEQSITLGNVKIRDNAEDPATRTKRKAIATVGFNSHEVATFRADIYLKVNIPRWMKQINERVQKKDSLRRAQGNKIKKQLLIHSTRQ